jgi:hypothetical protein
MGCSCNGFHSVIRYLLTSEKVRARVPFLLRREIVSNDGANGVAGPLTAGSLVNGIFLTAGSLVNGIFAIAGIY